MPTVVLPPFQRRTMFRRPSRLDTTRRVTTVEAHISPATLAARMLAYKLKNAVARGARDPSRAPRPADIRDFQRMMRLPRSGWLDPKTWAVVTKWSS